MQQFGRGKRKNSQRRFHSIWMRNVLQLKEKKRKFNVSTAFGSGEECAAAAANIGGDPPVSVRRRQEKRVET